MSNLTSKKHLVMNENFSLGKWPMGMASFEKDSNNPMLPFLKSSK